MQLGAAWGHFKSEPMLKLWTSYRLSDTLSLEGTFGQVQGVFSGTDLWHVDVLIEPWSDQRISPFFGVGVGKFRNFPNLSLIGATDDGRKARGRRRRRSLLPDRALRDECAITPSTPRSSSDTSVRPSTGPGPRGSLLLLTAEAKTAGNPGTPMNNKTLRKALLATLLAAMSCAALAQPRRRANNDQVVVPAGRPARHREAQVPVERLRGRPLHRHLRDAELRLELGLRRAHRLPHHRGFLRRRRATARPRSATSCSARSCPAASSRRHREARATTTSRSATTSSRARSSSAAGERGRRSSTSSAASAAPSSSTSASPTFNVGFGYRVYLADWVALQLDLRDHIFSLDLLGKRESTQNLELTGGLTFYF